MKPSQRHKLAFNGLLYEWEMEETPRPLSWDQDYKEKTITIFRDGIPVFRYRGDPHDMTVAGVKRVIREERL